MFKSKFSWLQQGIERLSQDRQHRRALLATVETLVDIADTKIRLAHRYRQALLAPVATATSYCRQLVQALPGPVRLHPQSYHDDPLVKAIFATLEEMETTLRQARNTDPPGSGERVYGLLTMGKNEKTIYGPQQQGELLVRDVAMQAVTFVDHRVVALAADLEATRDRLQQRALEILATVAMENIATQRASLAELRERRERLAAMQRILGGKRRTFELFPQGEQGSSQKIGEVQALLKTTDTEIETARQGTTPEEVLDHLRRLLISPAETMAIQGQSLVLNWMNVIVAANGHQEEGHAITLAELILKQELRRWAMLVCFDRRRGA